ncbi:glucosamine-6-phosphate deaminase [uncultured Parabacteroides sp.]|uniref:glucosamine-6-phosphate deaminase n=1 Tax=uncultured Parabacteroides sp. TaxID=512312 RepID=UPI0025E98826|nr:glucosamine-6-phosphate deaminase [uncultured Parabacteroides sp.]
MEYIKDKLLIKIFDNRSEMGVNAAKDVAECIRSLLDNKDCVNMIFAAAPSQNDFLEELLKKAGIDWTRVNAFHMDEYIGLEMGAIQSFGTFLKERIFDKVPFKSVNYINGQAINTSDECLRYAALLDQYPVDIVCLGIGENGHIAFNDPHVAHFDDREKVKIVSLDDKCRMQQVHDGCFSTLERVPVSAFTLTIPALMAAKYMFCIVPSKTKNVAVFKTINGPISESCPASILRTKENTVLYLDADSSVLLNKSVK